MKIKITESKLRQIVNESVRNVLTEAKSLKRKGTIEMNGERIDAIEDKLDKYGNPTYKVKHPSVKGRKDKNGYTRVQSYTFKPTNESLNKIVAESVKNVLREFNISSVYGSRRKPETTILSNKLNIISPIYDFVNAHFGDDAAEDLCNYLYDNNVGTPNVINNDEESFTIDDQDYNNIINTIKQYPNNAIANAVIETFNDIVYNHDYDSSDWGTDWDYIDYSE